MNKEHGQVTGLIWRGAEDLATYHSLKEYANKNNLSTSTAAKQLIKEALTRSNILRK